MRNLDALMGAVLLRLELASHTSAAAMDSDKVSHGKSEGNQPPRVAMPHLHYRWRYSTCRSDRGRREVIADALNELRSIRYSRRPNVDRDTKEGRLIIGRDPRHVSVVAYVYGYSERHVYRLRVEARVYDASSVRRVGTMTQDSFLDVRREAA